MDTRVSVQFLGGIAEDQELTGSCILLQVEAGKNKSRFLIDAGLLQCRFRDSIERNLEILKYLKPELLDGVILTHSHVDHSGRIPLLTKNGFGEKIFCTEQTANLLPIMLADVAKIQSLEIGWRNKKHREPLAPGNSSSQMWQGKYDKFKRKEKLRKKSDPLRAPLYTMDDAEEACSLIKTGGCGYEEWIRLAKGLDLKFYPSGHVLGGAICVFRIAKRNCFLYLGFSGDLGRSDGIILPPPKAVQEPIDYWFTESTYGGKKHPPREEEIERLIGVINEGAMEKRKIIIPSFALERTQEIIFLISKYTEQGRIRRVPIFIDSPLAAKITQIFSASWNSPGLFKGQSELSFNPFCPEQNKLLRLAIEQAESSKLIASNEPGIIIAGSGMCDAGRVRGHLRVGLGKESTTVCLVGYMAEGSLGRKLKEGWPLVRMNREEIIVKAKIVVFESFSAHADSPFLNAYAKLITENNPTALKGVFVIHGERKSGLDLKIELMQTLNMEGDRIIVPKIGDVFAL